MTVCLVVMAIAMCADAGAEDSLQVPNRMAKSEIGEWVVFNLPDGDIQKHIVVKRDGEGVKAQVTIRVDNIYDGEVVNSEYIVEDAGESHVAVPPPHDEKVKIRCRDETIGLKGNEYKGVRLDVERDGKPYQTWYISSDIPVYGLIRRSEANGAEFEIADFGMN